MRFFLVIMFLSFLSVSAHAAPTLTQCTMKTGGSGWVPDVFVVAREGISKSVTVSGPLILRVAGVPQPGRILRDNARKTVITWKIKGLRDSRGSTTPAMVYRATLKKSNNSIKVTAQPLGFSEIFTRAGACAPLAAAEVRKLSDRIVAAGRKASANGGMLHSLWRVGKPRAFSCSAPQMRRRYDWQIKTVKIRHDPKSKVAEIEYQMHGFKGARAANAQATRSKKTNDAYYKWSVAVKDPRGRGVLEPEVAKVDHALRVNERTGKASLQSSAYKTRNHSSGRVGAICKG